MDFKQKYKKYKQKYINASTFTYKVPKKYKNEVNEYLQDERGWVSKGYKFKQVHNNPKIEVYFKTNEEIKEIFKGIARLHDLSVTDRGSNPIKIYFNINNWENPPKAYETESNNRLKQYREYLVQHEFGHAIGYNHHHYKKKYSNCPVMLQQSKYTEPYCKANSWVSLE
tara:strand:- start:357 stop:863 length:507 start_codon:yes stop_codon:yes gene_type:complete